MEKPIDLEFPSISIQIISEACQSLGYKLQELDSFSQYLFLIQNGEKECFISPFFLYPSNSRSASEVSADKAFGRMVLAEKNIPLPKGDYFFTYEKFAGMAGKGKDLADAKNFAKKLGYPVFIKPNHGSLGYLCQVVRNDEELEAHFEKIKTIDHIAIIEEYIQNQDEHRIFLVNNKIAFAYSKKNAEIIGDGKTSIRELIAKIKNSVQETVWNRIVENADFFEKTLEENNIQNHDHVLEDKKKLPLVSVGNLAQGGTITEFFEPADLPKPTHQFAKTIQECFPGLAVCGIDVFGDLKDPSSWKVIEVNKNPFLKSLWENGKKEKAIEIMKEILENYFEKN